MESYAEVKKTALELISGAKKILIVPSSPVDADALGSALALTEILESFGKTVTINYSFENLGNYKLLPGAESIVISDLTLINLSRFELIIFLDSGSLTQFYNYFKHRKIMELPAKPLSLNIDHHLTNDRFASVTLHNVEVSSTAEIIYDLFKGGPHFNGRVATNLLAGIINDTGNFQHGRNLAKVLRIAADLVEAGADLPWLVLNLYYRTTARAVRLAGYLCQKIEIDEELHYGFFEISFSEWQKFNLTYDELRDGYNRALNDDLTAIEGLDFVFVIVEREPGYVKVSFRARGSGFNLTPVAKSLGGGGHPAACGANVFDRSVTDVVNLVKKSIGENYAKIRVD